VLNIVAAKLTVQGLGRPGVGARPTFTYSGE